jgi:protein-disulfide isomerase
MTTSSRRRPRLVAAFAVVLALLAVGTLIAVSRTPGAADGVRLDASAAPALSDVAAPAVATAGGGIPVSAAGVGVVGDDDVVVEVVSDLLCPWCARFQESFGAELERAVDGGGVTVVHRPVTFLDERFDSTHSTRAANAAAIVAERAPDQFQPFLAALYAHQPEDRQAGLSDERIGQLAADAGVPADVVATFTDTVEHTAVAADGGSTVTTVRTFAPWLAAATAHAVAEFDGLAVPSILVDGETFTPFDPDGTPLLGSLTEAIDAARA